MRWIRDVLFVGLVMGGLLVVGANLVPPRASKSLASVDSDVAQEPSLRAAVERVNASFRQQWSNGGVQAATPAPDLLVARRLALGLMGTVPSLEEIQQFERLPDGQRLRWWLEYILQDRRFVDYFAERLARASVGTEDGPFIFFRRRRLVSWLEEQLVQNRPYNEIVFDLIADDGLWTDKPATNFVSVTSQQDKDNQPDPVRLAGRVTRAFLGLRLDCAQCHDHPYAKWVKEDFDGLTAYFGQTHLGFKGIYDGTGEFEVKERKTQAMKTVPPRVPFAADLLPAEGTRRRQLAAWVTHRQNKYFSRAAVNRTWALLCGRPLVEPVDNLEPDGPLPPALDILADDFAEHGFDLRRLIRVIASAEAFRLDSASTGPANESGPTSWAVFPLTRLRPEQVAGSVQQASSVSTLSAQSHVLGRLIRYGDQNEFVTRYGDSGEDELEGRGGTIPQRLLLMNGKLVREKIVDSPFNSSTRIAWMVHDDARAVDFAYLAILTRHPTPAETDHFAASLADSSLERTKQMEDLFWALINSTEFSWNH